jgi:hypothetical protein
MGINPLVSGKTQMGTRLTKAVFVLLFVGTAIGLFPFALRIANSFATHPWNQSIDARVLLLWSDHIELRPVGSLSEFSPRTPGAGYSFIIPPERQKWVTEQLRAYNPPTSEASWRIRIRSLGPSRQEIDLELLGDGIYGMIYEASSDKVVPLRSRLAGPGFAFIVLGVDAACWVALWFAIYALKHLFKLAHSLPVRM